MLDQPEFGQRLKHLRVERGLSQAALADGLLSTSYLSRLESGARPPTRRIVEQLAARLGASAVDFDSVRPDGSALARLVAVAASAGTGSPFPASPTGVDAPAADAPSLSFSDGLSSALEEALVAAQQAHEDDPALRWQARWLLAHTRRSQRRPADELRLFAESAELADQIGAAELQVRSRVELARTLAGGGDYAAARRAADQALDIATAAEVGPEERLAALHALAAAEAESGHLAEAREHAEALLTATAGLGGLERAKALWTAASVRMRQTDQAGARSLMESALAELDSRTDPLLWLRLRLAAASLYLQSAEPLTEAAAARLDEAERAVDLVGAPLHHDQLRALRARLAYETGRYAQARELAGDDAESLERLSFRDSLRLEVLRAQLRMRDGEIEAGTLALQELATRAQEALNVDLAAEIWRDLARTVAEVRLAPGSAA
jgi:transcriptional regulator with XRE-family HTH domain